MEKAKGIDVSHWQGRIDFDKVKSQGYSFVMINAGYGKYISQKDENFEKNYAAARKAGLNIGTYWYSYALTEADALAEAKTFLEAVKGKMFEYPLAFDIEDASQSELPNAAINKIIEAFCDYLESNGYYAAVCSYANFFKRKVSDSVKNRYDIWVAHFDVACHIKLWNVAVYKQRNCKRCFRPLRLQLRLQRLPCHNEEKVP